MPEIWTWSGVQSLAGNTCKGFRVLGFRGIPTIWEHAHDETKRNSWACLELTLVVWGGGVLPVFVEGERRASCEQCHFVC